MSEHRTAVRAADRRVGTDGQAVIQLSWRTLTASPVRPVGGRGDSETAIDVSDGGEETHVAGELEHCNGTYRRDSEGVWRYHWGDPVPGAVDLTLADLLAIQQGTDVADARVPLRAVSQAELAWLTGRSEDLDRVFVRRRGSNPPDTGDLVVGMWAPELHVLTMLTVTEIAELAGVSKATIDSYRYRGYLPEPQATRGRTPLWARPVVQRWLRTRPGCGWRSDIYGSSRPVGARSGDDEATPAN